MKKETIVLRDGSVVIGDAFDREDFELLREIFKDWLVMNEKLKN